MQNGESTMHAAPTELGRELGALGPINMALLTELLLSQDSLLSAVSKLTDDPPAAFDGIPTAAIRSASVIPFHSKFLWPALEIRASAATPNPAHARSAAAGCAIR